MKYGKLKVTIDYGDGFLSEDTYHAWSFVNDGVNVSALTNINSVDHAAQIHYDVDVMVRPQDIFGTANNITFTWIEQPIVINLYIKNGDDLDTFKTPGLYCCASSISSTNVIANCPPMMYTSTFTVEVFPAGKDGQDTFKTPGLYCCASSISSTNVIANCPPMMYTSTFTVEVFPAGKDGQLIQRATRCHKTSQVVAQRVYYANTWGEWETISMNGQKVLWEGARYMTADHTCNLSDTVLNQANGITLVFSSYADNKAVNSNFHFQFVPKHFVKTHPGCGVSVLLSNADFAHVGHKYIYVNNNSVVGHVSNDDQRATPSGITHPGCGVSVLLSNADFAHVGHKYIYVNNNSVVGHVSNDDQRATPSGITIDNKYFVLRYVLGC